MAAPVAGMSATRRATHPLRAWHVLAVLSVVLAVAWLVVTSLAAPLHVTCDPSVGTGPCGESVTAALSRGLQRPHGLLLEAYVEPGPDRGPGQLGHRATVTFDVLGAPAPVGVALHLDMGGHWGGVVDRDRLEVAAVPVVQSMLIIVLGLGAAWLVRAVGPRRDRRDNPSNCERGDTSWNERT